jgi:hypothetical protein
MEMKSVLTGKTFGTDYAGGYVFYNDGNGGGLVSAKTDQSTSQVWITGGSTQTTLNGNTLTAIGTGQANTTAIINQTGHTGSAAKVCDDYTDGTYTDWYLPSRDELNLMFTNLEVDGVGGFAAIYWSSSEIDANNAWVQFFHDMTGPVIIPAGAQKIYDKSWDIVPIGGIPSTTVRAVRAF